MVVLMVSNHSSCDRSRYCPLYLVATTCWFGLNNIAVNMSHLSQPGAADHRQYPPTCWSAAVVWPSTTIHRVTPLTRADCAPRCPKSATPHPCARPSFLQHLRACICRGWCPPLALREPQDVQRGLVRAVSLLHHSCGQAKGSTLAHEPSKPVWQQAPVLQVSSCRWCFHCSHIRACTLYPLKD